MSVVLYDRIHTQTSIDNLDKHKKILKKANALTEINNASIINERAKLKKHVLVSELGRIFCRECGKVEGIDF